MRRRSPQAETGPGLAAAICRAFDAACQERWTDPWKLLLALGADKIKFMADKIVSLFFMADKIVS
tara:strand:- start:143 stop:337 length:195 start_codon:yes stop_codon:yes gene_type:complete